MLFDYHSTSVSFPGNLSTNGGSLHTDGAMLPLLQVIASPPFGGRSDGRSVPRHTAWCAIHMYHSNGIVRVLPPEVIPPLQAITGMPSEGRSVLNLNTD